MTAYEHIARHVFNKPWAITEDGMALITAILREHIGGTLTSEDIAARLEAVQPRPRTPSGSKVAVLPLHGPIFPRANLMTQMSGATSAEGFGQMFRTAMADPEVRAIAIDVDSPGGSVFGIDELATEMRAARGQKPVIAVSNHLMASAAYYIASSADEIWVSPTSLTGSIGVLAVVTDASRAEDAAGYTNHVISAGRYKAEDHPMRPIGDEALAYTQSLVDGFYDMFVAAVAAGRGVPASQVRGGMGEGRVLNAKAAVRAGLADKVATLETAIARLAGGYQPKPRAAAAARAEQMEPLTVQLGTEPVIVTLRQPDPEPEPAPDYITETRLRLAASELTARRRAR